MNALSFKQRVCNAVIKGASDYKKIFLEYEYLIYSEGFKNRPYYILNGILTNYLHLTGVNTSLSTYDFFNSCLNGALTENDFDFIKPKKSEASVKGSVRQKIRALSLISLFFSNGNIIAEEDLSRNSITCSLATANEKITIGFANVIDSKPKTLLLGNELNKSKSVDVSLVLRRRKCEARFDTIICGDIEKFLRSKHAI